VRRDAQRYYGRKPAARDHSDRQSSNYAVKIPSKTSLNLVREFEVNTLRVVPHNSNCKFLTALLQLCFKKLGANGTVTEYGKRHNCRKKTICVAGSDNLNIRMFTMHVRSSDLLSEDCNYFKPICCSVTNTRPIYVIFGTRYELRCAMLFRHNTVPRSMEAVKPTQPFTT
jgi:hypothetical protein